MHFAVWYGNCPAGHNILGETVKRLCKDAGIEGPFTNNSLRATTATGGLQKGIPHKFVMERTKPKDVRSLQKYQHPDTSSKIEFQRSSTAVKPCHYPSQLLLKRCQ